MSDINPQAEAAENVQPDSSAEQAPSVTDLDGLSEFQFQGQKYTPDKLLEIVSGYQKYSESAKERAEAEEYDKHFEVDRAKLLKDPSLADQFKQKYPPRYHWVLDFLPKGQRQETAQPNPAQSALPPEIQKEIEDLKAWKQTQEQRAFQAEVQNAQAQIDKITEPLFKKFPMADEAAVFAKADALLSNGSKLTEKTWERLIRENHESAQKRWDQFQGATIKQQLEKGRRAQDVGPGGATPGQAPQRPKTMREAEEAWLKQVMSGGMG